MICPESGKITSKKESQWLEWVKEKVGGVKPLEDEILIPQPRLMRQICMENFLIPSKELFIAGDFYPTYDISSATNGIVHLFESCYRQKVWMPGNYYPYISTMESLKEV